MKINYTLKKALIISVFFLFTNINFVYSEIIKNIEVMGNDRLAKETIILFSELNVNDNINSEDLNNAFKKLFKTDYFKNIKINFENNNLQIEVRKSKKNKCYH